MTIAITRTGLDAAGFRRAAAREKGKRPLMAAYSGFA